MIHFKIDPFSIFEKYMEVSWVFHCVYEYRIVVFYFFPETCSELIHCLPDGSDVRDW